MSDRKPVVLITGVNGYIGTATARELLGRYHVVGFDRDDNSVPDGVEFVRVDLTSDEEVEAGVGRVREQHGGRLASVIHLAAYYDFSGEPSPLYHDLTVLGTDRLLRALQPLEVGQFVFSSTLLVHAPGEPGRPISEDWPLGPTWAYPKSKVAAEAASRR